MTATAHALVGGAIAAAIPNPVLGLTIAFISHPLLDMIPHWDFGWGWREKSKKRLFIEGSIDLFVGVTLAYLLFAWNTNFWYLSFALLLSLIWDIAEIPYWFWNWRKPPISWIYQIQSKIQGKTKTMFGGIMTQLATISIAILIVLLVK